MSKIKRVVFSLIAVIMAGAGFGVVNAEPAGAASCMWGPYYIVEKWSVVNLYGKVRVRQRGMGSRDGSVVPCSYTDTVSLTCVWWCPIGMQWNGDDPYSPIF